jgi:DNA-binding response OmpR family regulator
MTDTKHTVLLVEDEASAALVLGNALRNEGLDVITAGDGIEGLKTAIDKHPDLILADLLLPRMGGMEMIREIRKDAWGKTVPIMILTNVSDVSALEEAIRQETFYYIMKGDTSLSEVVKKVKTQLKMETAIKM